MSEENLTSKIIKNATTKEGLGTIGGAVAGGWIGSSVGLAALGTAVAGTLPIAIVGGAIGYLGVKAYKNTKRNKDTVIKDIESLEKEEKNKKEDSEL